MRIVATAIQGYSFFYETEILLVIFFSLKINMRKIKASEIQILKIEKEWGTESSTQVRIIRVKTINILYRIYPCHQYLIAPGYSSFPKTKTK